MNVNSFDTSGSEEPQNNNPTFVPDLTSLQLLVAGYGAMVKNQFI